MADLPALPGFHCGGGRSGPRADTTACGCRAPALPPRSRGEVAAEATSRSVLVLVLSSLIAFFPKCPVCWAAYMNMLGCVWLTDTAYARWLFPGLLVSSGAYLAVLLGRSRRHGYAPFLLSLAGLLVILASRSLFADERWAALPGIAVMLSGSLLHLLSMSAARRPSARIRGLTR